MVKTTFRYDSDWKLTLAVAFLLPILLVLGFWQLQRAEEKRELLQHFEDSRSLGPVDLLSLDTAPDAQWAHRQVEVSGRFDNKRQFYLDNRISHGRFGYEIITPFKLLGNEQFLLVNRGWVEGSLDRKKLPAIGALEGEIRLQGEIYVPTGQPFLLADIEAAQGWPKVVQIVDIPVVAKLLDEAIFPYQLRLKAHTTGAFVVDWPVVNVQPEKHTAYAVQWFAMSLALVFLHLARSTNLWQLLKGGFK